MQPNCFLRESQMQHFVYSAVSMGSSMQQGRIYLTCGAVLKESNELGNNKKTRQLMVRLAPHPHRTRDAWQREK